MNNDGGKSMNKKPPKIAGWLLRKLSFYNNRYAIFEDIAEEYNNLRNKKGRLFAWLWFWGHTAASIFENVKLSFYRGIMMFENYLKVAIRNIIRRRLYSLINISGLAIGMTCAILIMIYVQYEIGFNRFHENADRVFRVNEYIYMQNSTFNVANTVTLTGPTMKRDYPEIIDFSRYYYISTTLISYNDRGFYENSIIASDKSFFDMFTFPLVKGNIEDAFNDPNSILIDEDIAEKYFGNDDPIGKILKADNRYTFTVKGVLKNIPSQSNIKFKIVVPWAFLNNFSWYKERWDDHMYYTYVLLDEYAVEEDVEEKIKNVFKDHNPNSDVEYYLEPLKNIHLHSEVSTEGSSNIKYIYFLSLLGAFILLIACINFMNITTAHSSNRFKEIGMRKVVGGKRKNIIMQFLSESIMISFLSLISALILVQLVLPYFSSFTGKELSLNITNNPLVFFGIFTISLLTGIIAGSYPAMYLSSFNPVCVLKGTIKGGNRGSLIRKALVVFQFTGSVILIAGTITVYSQIEYMLNKDLGWNKDHMVYLQFRGDSQKYFDVLKNELSKNSRIISVASALYSPTNFRGGTSGIEWTGKDPAHKLNISYNFIDFDYLDTVEYEIVEGRKFSRDYETDASSAFIVNESLAKIIGNDQIIGLDAKFWGYINGRIIGVVKDFHFRSMHQGIKPMLFRILSRESSRRYAILKINTEDINSTLRFIEDSWKKIIPDYPIINGFVDEQVNSMYQDDERIGKMLQYFAGLAVFIGCMGLFGLVSYAAEKRKKEIGIRKTLGASVSLIVRIILKEFIFLIIIANAIAWPAAYFLMRNWLDGYAYRINMGPEIFILAGLIILLIALLTVVYHSIKAALANPVDSLKYE